MLRKLRWQETPYPAHSKAKKLMHGIEDEEDSIGVVAVSTQYSNRQGKYKVQIPNQLQQQISHRDKSNIQQEEIFNATAAKDGDISLMIAPHHSKAVFVVVTAVVVAICEEEEPEAEEEEDEICNVAEAAIRQ